MWAIIEGAGAQVLSLLVFVILARFLTPSDFGTVGLALMLSEACALALVEPIATTIVVRRQSSQDEYSTAFWLSVAAAVFVVLLINVAAPWASRISGYENLPLILAMLSPTILVQALSRVPEAWLSRSMQFRTLAIRRGLASIAGGAAGLLAVVMGGGVYALVVQQVVGVGVGAAALWALSPWRPTTRLSAPVVRHIGEWAVKLAPNSMATYLVNSLDAVAVSILAGPATGGLYSAAKRLRLAPQLVLVNALGRVTLSQFSQPETSQDRLGATFVDSAGTAMFLTLPLFVGASLVAPEICHVLLGPKWDGIAPIFAVLMLMLPFGLMNNLLTNLYLVRSRLRLLTGVKFAQILLFTLAVLFSAHHPAIVTAWATLIPFVIVIPVMGLIAADFTPFPFAHLCARLARPLSAAAGMAVGVQVLRPRLAAWDMGPRMVLLVMAGAMLYGALAILLCRPMVAAARDWLRQPRGDGQRAVVVAEPER